MPKMGGMVTNTQLTHMFDGAEVRVVIGTDGEPWFVAADVARVLGYTNPHEAVRTHCKGVSEILTPSAGGQQTVKIIPERDVYRLVMRSRMPNAERFEEWVVGDVLPSIRKTGGYGQQDALAVLSDPAALRKLLGNYAERVLALQADVDAARPKVEVYDRIVATGDTLGFREAAKLIRAATGANENETRTLMIRRHWIQRLGKQLAPAHVGETRGYVTTRDCEWTDSDGTPHVKPELRVTQKGLARAIELLIATEVTP